MTLDEYRKSVLNEFKSARSNTTPRKILLETKQTLADASISIASRRLFWTKLYDDLALALKEVSHSETHRLVSQAQADLAQMLSSGELL